MHINRIIIVTKKIYDVEMKKTIRNVARNMKADKLALPDRLSIWLLEHMKKDPKIKLDWYRGKGWSGKTWGAEYTGRMGDRGYEILGHVEYRYLM